MGAKSSPYFAISTLHYHLNKIAKENSQKREICEFLKDSLYIYNKSGHCWRSYKILQGTHRYIERNENDNFNMGTK